MARRVTTRFLRKRVVERVVAFPLLKRGARLVRLVHSFELKILNKRIVLAGGPGTGKTSVINALKKERFYCFEEAAREIFNKFKEI